MQDFTTLFRAGPAKIAKISVIPMAAQRCMSTIEGTLLLNFILFHSEAYVSMVRNIAARDIEQPIVDISSNASFTSLSTLKIQKWYINRIQSCIEKKCGLQHNKLLWFLSLLYICIYRCVRHFESILSI